MQKQWSNEFLCIQCNLVFALTKIYYESRKYINHWSAISFVKRHNPHSLATHQLNSSFFSFIPSAFNDKSHHSLRRLMYRSMLNICKIYKNSFWRCSNLNLNWNYRLHQNPIAIAPNGFNWTTTKSDYNNYAKWWLTSYHYFWINNQLISSWNAISN